MNFQDMGIFGFDVSFYQDNNQTPQQIDFVKMRNYGTSFIVVKIGQNTYQDSDFVYNWREAKNAGIPRAGYWFLDVNSTPESQASLCWNAIKNDPPEGPIFVDFEHDLFGMNPSASNVKSFITYFQQLSGFPDSKIGVYTGYYFWKEHAPTDPTQLQWFSRYLLWLAWYTTNPASVLIPQPWTECILWQDGLPAIGSEVGVESSQIDHNKFNGDSQKFYLVFGSASSVMHTVPYEGVDEYVETIDGAKCHISIVDLQGKAVRVRHFGGSLGYTSTVGKEPNVIMAFNGEDYDKYATRKYYPKHLAYTDGQMYEWTNPADYAYWMDISSTNQMTADFRNPPAFWNATSFIRPLVINGDVAPDIKNNPDKIEYTEIHAYSALGFTRDGKLIQIVAEGKVDPSTGIAYRGITIPELADLLVKYNALFAGQHGGGGDSCKSILGTVVNEPSDPTERAVVQVIEILSTGGSSMNGTAKEKLGNTSTVRATPSRYGRDTGRRIYPYSTIEFIEIVPVVVSGISDNPDDKWLKLSDGNYVNYVLSAREYYTILTYPPTDPTPTPGNDKIEIYVNGVLTYSITGTIDVP